MKKNNVYIITDRLFIKGWPTTVAAKANTHGKTNKRRLLTAKADYSHN